MVLSNTSLPNAPETKSRLGLVIVMADGSRRANIVHYGSCRCYPPSCSVRSAKLLAIVHVFGSEYVICEALIDILRHPVDIEAYIDSHTLFNIFANDCNTIDRILKINAFALTESYKYRKVMKFR